MGSYHLHVKKKMINLFYLSMNENMKHQFVRKQLMHLQVYQTFLQSHYISAAFLVLENMVDIAYVIFAIFRGFTISTTAIMVNRAIKLGGKYWHYLFDLPTGKK